MRKPRNGHGKNFKWPVCPGPLTFWPCNGARHIVTSWVVSVYLWYQWIGEIVAELQSGHGINFERPVDLYPENGARHIAPHALYICHIWRDSGKQRGNRRADKIKILNDPCYHDLWSFDHEMVIHFGLMCCVCILYEVDRWNSDEATEHTC